MCVYEMGNLRIVDLKRRVSGLWRDGKAGQPYYRS